MIGEVIDDYRILEEIGGGSAASVYKAVQISLDRIVALKVLHSHLASDSGYLRRFYREAESVANLTHPNIVQIYDIGRKGEIYYLAMEYCSGTTLGQMLTERHKLDLASVDTIATQIAQTLSYIHEHGFVHRDIKPSNIIVGENGQVKITDLGIARAVEGTGITVSGIIVGTPEYMSPEQVKGEKVNASTDIYSLGIVIYEMLTGELPFKAENPVALARQHIYEPPPPMHSLGLKIYPGIENVIFKAIAKSLEKRYRSCREFLSDWEEALKFSGSVQVGERRGVLRFVSAVFLIVLASGLLLWKLPDSMYVSSIPGDAEVYLDGDKVGTTPKDIVGVYPGRHKLTVEKDGYQAYSTELNVSRWKKLSIFVPLQRNTNPVAVNLPSRPAKKVDSLSDVDVAKGRRNIIAAEEKTQLRIVKISWDERTSEKRSNLMAMVNGEDRETINVAEVKGENLEIPNAADHSGGETRREESLPARLIDPDFNKWIHDKSMEYVPPNEEVMSEIPLDAVESFAEGNVQVGKISALNRATGCVALHIRGVEEGDILHVIRRRRFVAGVKITRVYDFDTAVGTVTESSEIWRINPGDIVIGD